MLWWRPFKKGGCKVILLIDNYDSFTYNLYQYIGEIEKDIRVLRNDEITADGVREMNPDKIVISPGPKSPDEAGNCVSIIQDITGRIPILGICLGHQSIGRAFGGRITYANKLHHGKQSTIYHKGGKIFNKMNRSFPAARYHSLVIESSSLPQELKVTAETEDGEIMAVEHNDHPTVGLQFHPESIYTPEGMQLIKNFFTLY